MDARGIAVGRKEAEQNVERLLLLLLLRCARGKKEPEKDVEAARSIAT